MSEVIFAIVSNNPMMGMVVTAGIGGLIVLVCFWGEKLSQKPTPEDTSRRHLEMIFSCGGRRTHCAFEKKGKCASCGRNHEI